MAYPTEVITESEVKACLDRAGLKWKDGHRYIVAQCPLHEDKNPSTQIFKDDWFANCMSGCGRFHITKAFPDLRPWKPGFYKPAVRQPQPEQHYKEFDLYAEWMQLPEIPREHTFKKIPLETLDNLGWRWTDGSLGMGVGYFIPYFDQTKDNIPFAQVRHLEGERRFTFLKDAKPYIYGVWNLSRADRLLIVEGASDCATLDYLGVPWIGMPSASSTELAKELGMYANAHGIRLVYAGDNDEAGDKLREAIDTIAHYRVCQPPTSYKDWSDFYQAEGYETVFDHAMKEAVAA